MPPHSAVLQQLTRRIHGEHAIGADRIDYLPRLLTPEDMTMMLRLRGAFHEENRSSLHKMFPTSGACIEPSKGGRWIAL